MCVFLFFAVVVPLCHEEEYGFYWHVAAVEYGLFFEINDAPTRFSRLLRALNAFIFTKRRVSKQETMIKLNCS